MVSQTAVDIYPPRPEALGPSNMALYLGSEGLVLKYPSAQCQPNA